MLPSNEKYKAITLRNFREVPEIKKHLSETEKRHIEVVGNVLPFKVNNYVIRELIDWSNIPNDPIFQLTFPQRDMLIPKHYQEMDQALKMNLSKPELRLIANRIRFQLNPNPSGQAANVPMLDGVKLTGIQHKYKETALFFPSNSQTCHAYCTFCFRWPQFVGIEELKFAMRETELLVKYVEQNPEITDVLFTGGDPMIMPAAKMASYLDPLIKSPVANLQTIRIGTKALGYWPNKFLTDRDADDMLRLFEKVIDKGYHLSLMAHFNHPQELKTEAAQKAIKRILNTGAQIRTQSPIMAHINDDASTWEEMWRLQVKLGCVPYYMFVARDTGAQAYFAVTLEDALNIYREAYKKVSGIARTVKGPSMSADIGKVEVLGINNINGEEVFTLRMLQGRDPDLVGKPFFASYNPDAVWLNDLKPAFNRESFFFEQDYMII